MIDSNMIEGIKSYSYSDILNNSHWVVYEGGLQFFDENNVVTNRLDDVKEVSFRIYTWGYNPLNYLDEKGTKPSSSYKLLNANYKISSECFKSTFYGYVEAY